MLFLLRDLKSCPSDKRRSIKEGMFIRGNIIKATRNRYQGPVSSEGLSIRELELKIPAFHSLRDGKAFICGPNDSAYIECTISWYYRQRFLLPGLLEKLVGGCLKVRVRCGNTFAICGLSVTY